MEKLPYTPAELEAELARLKPLLGNLTTNQQIKAACIEREDAEFDRSTEALKNAAFREHLRRHSPAPDTDPSLHRIWDEISLHDKFGATSQDLVCCEVIDDGTFLELGRLVDAWKRLDGDRGVALCLYREELVKAKARLEKRDISGAEFFNLFLRLEKVKYKIDEWNVPAMYDLRIRLLQCVRDLESKRIKARRQSAAELQSPERVQRPQKPPPNVSGQGSQVTVHNSTDTGTTKGDQRPHERQSVDNVAEGNRDRAANQEYQGRPFKIPKISDSSFLQPTPFETGYVAPQSVTPNPVATLTSKSGMSNQGPTNPLGDLASIQPSTSVAAVSALEALWKVNGDPYFKAMRKIVKKIEDQKLDLTAERGALSLAQSQIEGAKSCHEAVLQNVVDQSDNIYALCCQIKDDWSLSSIEAAATACRNFSETGDTILEAFDPIMIVAKTSRSVQEAELKCDELQESFDNMKKVAEDVMENLPF